jgi:hypothetical protein
MYVVHAEPVAEFPGRVIPPEAQDNVVGRLFRPIVAAWLRSVERQTEAAARQFDHAGPLEDHRAGGRH